MSTPLEGSAGVDGVFASVRSPAISLNSSRSVNVPPTSTASLYAIRMLAITAQQLSRDSRCSTQVSRIQTARPPRITVMDSKDKRITVHRVGEIALSTIHNSVVRGAAAFDRAKKFADAFQGFLAV